MLQSHIQHIEGHIQKVTSYMVICPVLSNMYLQMFAPNSWVTTFAASMVGGVAVTFFMTPFDVISTRLYNQPVCVEGRGVIYTGDHIC